MAVKRSVASFIEPTASTRAPFKKTGSHIFRGRDALGAYITNPEKYDSSRVISYDDNFVIVKDMYPKSSIHLLLLPRNKKFAQMHPFEAFEDTQFLSLVKQQVAKVKEIVSKELEKKYGQNFSHNSEPEVYSRDLVDVPEKKEGLPQRLTVERNWGNDVISGIHARPSMSHLHVHILSVDRYSDCLKHRKHYNSFATPFFISIEDFPLGKDDIRRYPEREGYLRSDLKCWRCGKEFGNKFPSLKRHLAEEFEEWKNE
ncbi:Aprataxin-like protein [Erysiphe necator]|nr:Aprataxin-like protein [Erysiphe necator]